jgi:hypothetical protein
MFNFEPLPQTARRTPHAARRQPHAVFHSKKLIKYLCYEQ